MKTWTVEQMLEEKPCDKYTKEVLTELWAGRETVSWLHIADMPISDEDKMWGAFRDGVLTKGETKIVLDNAVTRAIGYARPLCDDPKCHKWANDGLSGKDRVAWAAAGAARVARAAEAAWVARVVAEVAAMTWESAIELKLQVEDVRSVLTA